MTQRESIHAQGFAFATSADFCKVFEEDMSHLYRLAFLLTGGHAQAEQCFVAALQDARAEKAVFTDWARSWSRRSVIKNATQMIAPLPDQTSPSADLWGSEEPQSEAELSINALVKLRPFERFVFVLSVLESYTDRESANLLTCTQQDVRNARVRALQHLRASDANSTARVLQPLATLEFASYSTEP